jgi:hypothetical protein
MKIEPKHLILYVQIDKLGRRKGLHYSNTGPDQYCKPNRVIYYLTTTFTTFLSQNQYKYTILKNATKLEKNKVRCDYSLPW